MILTVSEIVGIAGIPSTNRGVRGWLKRNNIPVSQDGNRFTFDIQFLPVQVRHEVLSRKIAAAGLPLGTYDDDAHALFDQASPKMRAEALHKADIARFLVAFGQSLPWADRIAAAKAKFGAKGVSQPSLTRILKAVSGVDAINYAPALLADYRLEGRAPKPISEEAWSFFMTTIRDAGEQFPLKQAWRDARDLAPIKGWDWPEYVTICRRWRALPPAQRLHARLGHSETVKLLAQPAMRDKTSIGPLEWVSLDGRTKDFWAHNGDGKPKRYTFLALVDCATNFVLDWELAESENARATVRLIKRVCETYGIFDRLYPDNGSAFAGHLVAGGAVHRFRNSGKKMEGVKPLGICHHLGIKLHFALPANGQAKTAERTFATLSRVIDDRPEFKNAHAGHSAGAAPDGQIVPVDLEMAKAILWREVHRHNCEAGRRGMGMNGRSYQGAFQAGLAKRVRRQPTERQLYLAGLIYTPVSVDRWGRAQIDNWTYGQPDTQADLLPYYQSKQKILLGRDPDDFKQPALAWNEANELICEGIKPVVAGSYGSVDGIRDATRNRKAGREASKAAAVANNYLSNAALEAAMAAIPTPEGFTPEASPVVAGRFGAPLKQHKKAARAVPESDAVPEEFLKNFDARLAQINAGETSKLA